MKEHTISEEEARAIIEELLHSFVAPHNQKIIYGFITRLEKELEVE